MAENLGSSGGRQDKTGKSYAERCMLSSFVSSTAQTSWPWARFVSGQQRRGRCFGAAARQASIAARPRFLSSEQRYAAALVKAPASAQARQACAARSCAGALHRMA